MTERRALGFLSVEKAESSGFYRLVLDVQGKTIKSDEVRSLREMVTALNSLAKKMEELLLAQGLENLPKP